MPRRVAKNLGIPKGYRNYDELLADDEVNVVQVTSPNRVHFDQASRALQADKHVWYIVRGAQYSSCTTLLVE